MKQSIHNRILGSVAIFLSVTTGMLSAQTGKTYSQLKMEHPDWVQIPGELIRPDCVHAVPKGAHIEIGEDGESGDVTVKGAFVAHYDPCPEAPVSTRHMGDQGQQEPGPTGNGWVEASQEELSLKSSDNIDFMYGLWTVPKTPSENGATVFFFNGIEPSGGGWILQPVLQFGASDAGGGNYWAIASWFVGTSAYFSPLERVNAGDLLTGYTEQTGVSGSDLDYYVYSTDDNTGGYSWLSVKTHGLHWIWAYAGVLEAYNVTSCKELPSGSDQFLDSSVDHGYPDYDPVANAFYGAQYDYFGGGGPQCGFKVSVSGSTSTLYF
jgi:hypothetical protein